MIFKIVSWNVNSIRSRLDHLVSFIDRYDPDVICLQELKCSYEDFPHDYFTKFPYKLYIHGQKAYNGVAILSKFCASSYVNNFFENPIPDEARFIEIKININSRIIKIISLYAPNGGDIDSNKFFAKLNFYEKFINYLKIINQKNEDVIICGDYNIAPFNIDIYDEIILQNTTCCSLIEQKKFRKILNMNFFDNYRFLNKYDREFSWWDYKAGAFYKNHGLRIDHIISTSYITNYLTKCIMPKEERKREKPSDHIPIISIYDLKNYNRDYTRTNDQ